MSREESKPTLYEVERLSSNQAHAPSVGNIWNITDEKAIEYITNLIEFSTCKDVKARVLLGFQMMKNGGPIWKIAGSIGEALLTMNDPRAKTDVEVITDGLNSLQDRMLEEF
jgi:hypothetical protein